MPRGLSVARARRRPRVGRAGFTLAELLVAVTLMAVVLAGIFSIQDTLLRDQGRVLREVTVRNQADFARRLILRDVGEATVLMWPPVDPTTAVADELIGMKNLDPVTVGGAGACAGAGGWLTNAVSLVDLPKNAVGFPDPTGATAPNNNRRGADDSMWFRYCRGTGTLWRSHGVGCPPDPGAVACGAGCPSDACEAVAGAPVASVSSGFRDAAGIPGAFRRGARQDWVEANFSISSSLSTAGHDNAMIKSTTAQVMLSAKALRTSQ